MKYTIANYSTSQLSEIARDKMTTGIAKIVFAKKDGSVREATGTLMPSIVNKTVKGKKLRYAEGCIRFFDLSIGEWRSFRKDSIISVVPRNNFTKR